MELFKEYSNGDLYHGKYYNQVNFVSSMGDFRFHSLTQGEGEGEISSPFHWHEYIEILYCDQGEVLITADNAEYPLKAGDMMLIGPNVMHKSFKKSGEIGIIYNILFDPAIIQNVNYCSLENKCINSFLSYLSSFNYHYIDCVAMPEGMGALIRKMDQYFQSSQVYNCVYIRACLLEFIGKLCEHGLFTVEAAVISKQVSDAVRGTLDYINTHYYEKITLADMAEMANLSYYYYSKLFKMITGKTFVSFLASVRVFMAEKLMLSGEYSLQEVADKVGLYPQSTFNHTYKRLRGFSPNEFLKRAE